MHASAKIIRALIVFVSLSLMSACHSSRTTVRGSAGSSTTIPPKIKVDEMKRDVASREYDVSQIKRLIEEAASWIGTPYRYAGTSTDGTDCSGLIMMVFQKVMDVKLPRNSAKQQQYCKDIRRDKLQPGDLVFFATGSDRNRVSHVGLYIGEGDMIHASSSRGVIVSNLNEKYYDTRYHSGGRVDAVDRLYASAAKAKKKNEKKTKPAEQSQPLPATVHPDVPEISLEDFIYENPPQPLPAISDEDLDRAITEKVDSIFSGFFD